MGSLGLTRRIYCSRDDVKRINLFNLLDYIKVVVEGQRDKKLAS
jgi:hypothetical protein